MARTKVYKSASSNGSSSEEGDDVAKMATCIRRVANMSTVKPTMLMDTKVFDEKLLRQVIPLGAPKITKLLEKIAELDAKDMRVHKKHFKHMIFTDIESSNYGGKLLASAFLVNGFTPAFTNALSLKKDEELAKTSGANFGLLLSKTFGTKSMTVKFKKEQLLKFNERPTNAHGDMIRFMILDQGFKEGIDLFDVKYVHLFEPLVSRADEKQAIGRSTRFCGQKGLAFHPRFGWPLYVFRYDVDMGQKIRNAQTLFELYLEYSDIDMRRVVFAAELEKATVDASVDKQLTKEVHSFKIEQPPPVLTPKQHGGVMTRSRNTAPVPPDAIMGLKAMQTYVAKHFGKFSYPHVKLENKCETPAAAAASDAAPKVTFTPTQDFVRHFFQPASAYKGILLFHSVGTGKTCSAIATASTSFEKEGYSILWVTRHTLKSDIWKNMYDQICSVDIQERVDKGTLKLPKKVDGPMKYVSKNWIEPISYKQFSNMLQKDNKYYEEVVKRNGEKDPLRKTLVIIDEAHKLYAPNVVGSEKPDTDILEDMIQNSYKVSGKDSVRVMLMTATPYTEDGTEMLKLLNLLRPASKALPTEFDAFAKQYLDKQGYFTKQGLQKYQDAVSGYISYLNRSQDARNFAHPVIENVFVKMTKTFKGEPTKHNDKKVKEITQAIKDLRVKTKEEAAAIKDAVKETRAQCQQDQKEKIEKCKSDVKAHYDHGVEAAKAQKTTGMDGCKGEPVKERKACKEGVTSRYNSTMEALKSSKTSGMEKCKDLKVVCAAEKGQRLSNVQKDVKELKAKIEAEKAERQKSKAVLDDFRKNNKAMLEELKPLRTEAKELREERKALKEKIDELKAEKGVDNKNKLKALAAEMKELNATISNVRSKAIKIAVKKKLARIDVGRAVIGDVSQETALNKRCFDM